MQTATQTQTEEGQAYQEPAPLPSLAPGTKVQYCPYHGWDAPDAQPYRIYATTVTATEDGAGGVAYVLVPWETPKGAWQGRRIAPVDAQQVRPWPMQP
jgi:hypothetical protein